MASYRALLIPVEGPVQELELSNEDGEGLKQLQELVGGYIEAVDPPEELQLGTTTCYINEEGKLEGLAPNMRATDFMVPGVGLWWGDYVAGPMIVCGFNPYTGYNRSIPEAAVKRVRLIEEEAK